MTENIRSIPKALDGGWGWVVCGCSFLVNCILGGLMYSFGIMYVEFLDYFGTSKSRTSLTLSILQGIANGTGPLNAFLINRFGCRLVGSLGAVLQFCGYVISSWGTNLTYLYVSFGVLGGLGNGMIYISMLVAITQYFDKRRAIATGISVSGVGIGTFILGPLTKWLVDEYTWKGAMLIQGEITLNCLVCCLVYMPIEKADRLYHSDKAEAMKMISGEEVVGNRVSNVSAKVQVCVELEAAKKEISSEIMDSEKLDESWCTQENANLHEHTTTKDFNAYQKSKYCNAGGSVQCNDDRNPYVNECDLSAHRSLLKTRCVSKSTDKTVITFKDQFLQYVRLLSKLPFVLILIAITSTFLGQIIPYMYIVEVG